MRDIIEDELGGPTVLRDPEPLQFDYLPEELPHRDDAMRELARIFKPMLSSASGQHATVQGPVGSGKTALSKRFCRDFAGAAGDRSDVDVAHVHVNCRRRDTNDAALLKVIQRFDPSFPDRGFSISEKLETLRKRLQREDAHLIVILDEADVLLKKSGSDLVYQLTRFNEEVANPEHAVGVLLVSTRDVRPLLDEATQSTFKRSNVVDLGAYGEDQLRDIVHQRVDLAFHPGTFREELEGFVAGIASERGDARFAIEILQKAADAADAAGAGEVAPEHVRAAKASVDPHVDEAKVRDLDEQHRLTLLAIARVFQGTDEPYTITGEVEERYELVCEEFGARPRAHTQFWTYLKDLEAGGFIDAKRSGEGVQGTTTLISLPDVPAGNLVEVLEALLAGGERP